MTSTIFLLTIMLSLVCHTQAEADISPSSSKLDLLAQAIIAAQQSIITTQAIIPIVRKYANANPLAEDCISVLVYAIEDLNACLNAFKAYNPGRKSDVTMWSLVAESYLDACEDDFDWFQDKSSGPADVEAALDKAYKFHRILGDLVSKL